MNAHDMIIIIVVAYLLGAIPVGVIAARGIAGIDPRTTGSRNIGFTNVLRVAGKAAGVITLIGDMGKGIAAVAVARLILGPAHGDAVLVAGGAAILGHLFSVFIRFKGGKGVATAFGVFLALDPVLGGSLVGIWLASAALWRTSSLAALIAFASLPILAWIHDPRPSSVAFAVGVSVLVVYRHSENIKRLLAGTEQKWGVRHNVG